MLHTLVGKSHHCEKSLGSLAYYFLASALLIFAIIGYHSFAIKWTLNEISLGFMPPYCE